jgi:hypothetical protein
MGCTANNINQPMWLKSSTGAVTKYKPALLLSMYHADGVLMDMLHPLNGS